MKIKEFAGTVPMLKKTLRTTGRGEDDRKKKVSFHRDAKKEEAQTEILVCLRKHPDKNKFYIVTVLGGSQAISRAQQNCSKIARKTKSVRRCLQALKSRLKRPTKNALQRSIHPYKR